MENNFSQEKPSVYDVTQVLINLLLSKLSVLFEPRILKVLSVPALRTKRIPIKIDIWFCYISIDSSYNILTFSK